MKTRQLALTFVLTLTLIGCEQQEKLPRLTKQELQQLEVLEAQQNQFKIREAAYKEEAARLEALTTSYENDFLKVSHNLKKTNAFDDGKYRLCDHWVIKNEGTELVDEYKVKYTYLDKKGGVLGTWETFIVNANDTVKDELVHAIMGKQYPLKGGERRDYKNARTCHKESFLGWEPNEVKVETMELKLRPAVDKPDFSKHLKTMLNSGYYELQSRAKANGQLTK